MPRYTVTRFVRSCNVRAARLGRDGLEGARTCQQSQLSHFSSCLIVLVLATPQFAARDVAHGTLSTFWWPQPYWCTTLVHMLWSSSARGDGTAGETQGGVVELVQAGRDAVAR
jgi:hypothetical protein